MSLTVSQLMELPCLRRAKVVAGHRSLDRIVTCVSVLEYSTPTEIQTQLYDSIEFWGSELVITGFSSIANDVDAQCANIRKMAAAGEVGMILYYVGIILPTIDQRLIDLANELDFVLICMPENEPSLRYSEVIHEVMEAIFRDQLSNPTFTVDLLAFSEGGKFESVLWKQTVEGVRLGMGLWGQAHDKVDLSELVRAIIQDEPIKMRRLGDLYRIDVEALSDMWILKSQSGESLAGWVEQVREFVSQYTGMGLCERYENDILLFPTGSRPLRESQELAASLSPKISNAGLWTCSARRKYRTTPSSCPSP